MRKYKEFGWVDGCFSERFRVNMGLGGKIKASKIHVCWSNFNEIRSVMSGLQPVAAEAN